MRIKSNERIFITGQTQTGKTRLADSIFKMCKKGIAYDCRYKQSDLGYVVHTTDELINTMKVYDKIVFQPYNDTIEQFSVVCDIIFKSSNVMFYIDEAHEYANKHSIPSSFARIIKRGMARGIGVLMTTQRTADIHKSCISECQHIIVFRLFEPNQIEYMKKFMPYAEKAMTLQDYYFLHYDHKKIEIFKPI